jgi:hypothetical protein
MKGTSLRHVLHDLLQGLVLGQVKVLDNFLVGFPVWWLRGFPCGQHCGGHLGAQSRSNYSQEEIGAEGGVRTRSNASFIKYVVGRRESLGTKWQGLLVLQGGKQILEPSNSFVALANINGAPSFESDWTVSKICIADCEGSS